MTFSREQRGGESLAAAARPSTSAASAPSATRVLSSPTWSGRQRRCLRSRRQYSVAGTSRAARASRLAERIIVEDDAIAGREQDLRAEPAQAPRASGISK